MRQAFHRSTCEAIPSIEADKGAWYDYWDEDRSGTLEKEEVVRALLKTLKLTQDQVRCHRCQRCYRGNRHRAPMHSPHAPTLGSPTLVAHASPTPPLGRRVSS